MHHWSARLCLLIKCHGDSHLLEAFRTRMNISIKMKIKMSTTSQQCKQCRVSKTIDAMILIVCAFNTCMITLQKTLVCVLHTCCMLHF